MWEMKFAQSLSNRGTLDSAKRAFCLGLTPVIGRRLPATCLYARARDPGLRRRLRRRAAAVYLTALGLGAFQVGIVATLALLGSALMTLGIGLLGAWSASAGC